jgi:hypothetical protein
MKIKKLATKFSAVALIALALTSCKKTPNTPPEQDKEFQSSIDAAAATMIATDIDMMVAQASERSYMFFYSTYSATTNNTCTVSRDTLSKTNKLIFNHARGADGVIRNGTITISYTACSTGTVTAAGQLYIRNPNHMSQVTFQQFSVGKYVMDNTSYMTIKNTTPAGYTRSVTPLTWSMVGLLKFADTTDATPSAAALDMTWDGQFTKTLANSTSNTIHPGTTLPINWITGLPGIQTGTANTSNNAINPNGKNGLVKYQGKAKGNTGGATAYEFNIVDANPLQRDFGCSPDYYISPEQHPIILGKVSFKTGSKSIRTLYYADQTDLVKTCDNSGIVYIDGLSYNIDFWK